MQLGAGYRGLLLRRHRGCEQAGQGREEGRQGHRGERCGASDRVAVGARDPAGARDSWVRDPRRCGAHEASRPTAAEARPGRPGAPYGDGSGHRGRRRGGVRAESIPHHRAGRPAARQRPLTQGRRARPHPAAGPPPPGEDHPLRPRADPGAGRPRAGRRRPRHLHRLRQRAVGHEGRVPGQGLRDTGVRAVLDRAGVTRVGGHGAGHQRVRNQVLHRRGDLRPGRQQHPGLLHPGRHQVPGRDPRRQAAPGSGDPTGAERARHVLGLRLPAHRGPAPHDLEHVRPRHPPLVPDDGGLRCPHLPVREHRRRHVAGQVPLEAGPGRALTHLGGGAAACRHRPGLPSARPRGRDRGRRLPAVGARRAGLPRHSGGDCSRGSTCSTRRSWSPRSSHRCRRSDCSP